MTPTGEQRPGLVSAIATVDFQGIESHPPRQTYYLGTYLLRVCAM